MPRDRLTWREAWALLGDDRRQLLARLQNEGVSRPCCLWLYPPYLCVWLFRASQTLHSRGHRLAARCVRQVNLLVTGADFDPAADVKGGLVVLSPPAISVTGVAGRNLVLGPLTGLGTDLSSADLGAGPGRPILGDDVELGALSGVLGAVQVGNRVRIGPGCAVTRSIPDDTLVEPHPPRVFSAWASK